MTARKQAGPGQVAVLGHQAQTVAPELRVPAVAREPQGHTTARMAARQEAEAEQLVVADHQAVPARSLVAVALAAIK